MDAHATTATTTTSMRPAIFGFLAFVILLVVYFGVLSIISGWPFAVGQFSAYWYFILALAVGFGIQVGLFVRLRDLVIGSKDSGTVVAASGTTSTAAMVSCCAHYLANVAPVLGATGLVAFAAQYQVELFWVALLFNFAGIVYIGNKLFRTSREHAHCPA